MCAEWVGELELEAPQIGFGQLSYLLLFSFLCFVMVHDGRDEMIKVGLLHDSNIDHDSKCQWRGSDITSRDRVERIC